VVLELRLKTERKIPSSTVPFSTFDLIDFVFFGQIRIRFEIRTKNLNSERIRFGPYSTDFLISILYSDWFRISNSVEPNLDHGSKPQSPQVQVQP
jgi:hypothetical protein